MDEQLLQDDAAARISALDISRSFIIQAPAGSGKTELLIQRYLGLLATVEHPEEVMAITFTKKAAAEMQGRVLDALRRRVRADEPDEEHEKRTFELAGRALQKSEKLDWNLIANPRRMRILTLDALNASIARARPLTSAGTGARILVGAELQAIHQSASIATLDWLAETGDMQQATTEVLQHVDNNTWMYTSYLAQMLATRDQWLPFVGTGHLSAADAAALRGLFEESLEFAVTEHLQRTARQIGIGLRGDHGDHGDHGDFIGLVNYAAGNLLESDASTSPICRLAGLDQLPLATADRLPKWQGIAELLLTQKGLFRKKLDKRQGFPPGDKPKRDAMHGLLESLSTDLSLANTLHGVSSLPPVRYTDDQWRVLLALFRLLPLAVTELRRLFNEQGVADHIDVALTAGAALGTAESPGDVALLMDYQIKHLLVDEMQDTSAAQYRMLETLTGGWQADDGRSLCCVGDPMQSIYRFRNAEVGQFLLAREFGIGNIQLEPLLLRRNFRSGEQLVDWFNEVFPAVLAAHDDPLRGAVSYSEAVPAEHLLKSGKCVVHAIFGAELQDEAHAGCRVIATTLEENPDDDMVVLVRGRTQLPALLLALRDAGIPYRAIEIDRLTDLPEIIDVLALTRAAAHLGDRIAWLGVLRSPWIGLDWSDLHTLVRNDTNSTVWELLQSPDRLSRLSEYGQLAVNQALKTLALLVAPRRAQSLRDRVEKTWFALGGPALLDSDYAVENIYRYLDVLSKQERSGTLLDVGEFESILDLERVSNDDNARLQIMTMHRAKGLQFDHVLLYGLGRQPGHGKRRVLSWFDLPAQHGAERKVISPVGPRAELDTDPVHRFIELSEAEKDRHEQARLLYVACTRARKTLHLMGNTTVTRDGDSFKAARGDSLLHLLWPAVEADFEAQFDASKVSQAPGRLSPWIGPALRRFSSPWVLPDVPLLAVDTPPTEKTDDDKEVEFYWVGSDARVAGTLVHRWLQILADGLLADSRGGEEEYSRAVTLRWLSEAGISSEAAEPIVSRVELAVSKMLDDEKGRWILAGEGHAELALSGIDDGDLVSVIIDRVRIDENGLHWIVDYKTSSHEGGDLDNFLAVEAERYRSQLQRYRSIYAEWAGADVKCALYFPLLQKFVEVAV